MSEIYTCILVYLGMFVWFFSERIWLVCFNNTPVIINQILNWKMMTQKVLTYRLILLCFIQSQQIPNIINESEVNGPVRTCSETNLEQRHISFQERLTKTHAIWYLPDIGRSGAVHLLKDREPGVRTQSNTTLKSILNLYVYSWYF